MGTFEYIDANIGGPSPAPYQIHLASNDKEMHITWRYPHPRAIHFIQVFPVLGQVKSCFFFSFQKQLNKSFFPIFQTSLNIKCRLEYLQESHITFFPYVFFTIGDQHRTDIELPKRKLTASVWRIVIIDPISSLHQCELDDDSTETLQQLLNPRKLIGRIRIDSLFSLKNVPIIQANIKFNRISLSIMNNVSILKHQVPHLLEHYTLKVEEHVRMTEQFSLLTITDLNASISFYSDMQWKLYNEMSIGVDIFDSSFLNLIPFIDKILVKSFLEKNAEHQPYTSFITIDKFRIRYGPSVGFAFTTAAQIWQNILKDFESKNRLPIMTRYVICNSTSTPIKFGQERTDEQIWLQANECFYYAFRKENAPQSLKFSVKLKDNIVDVNDTFNLTKNEQMKSISVAEGKYLLITSRKISTTQRQIIIKGQIDILNMTNDSFQIHYRFKCQKLNEEENDETTKNQNGLLLAATSNGSFLEACNDLREAFIRLQVSGSEANGWSGEIPLMKATSLVPWLVKGTSIDRLFDSLISNQTIFSFL